MQLIGKLFRMYMLKTSLGQQVFGRYIIIKVDAVNHWGYYKIIS